LFSAIGTTYGGGDGSTTFNLPDLRGEFVRGLDDGRGVDTSRTLGSSQADATALPDTAFTGSTNTAGNHDHSYATNQGTGGGQGGGGADTGSRNATTNQAGSHSHSVTINGGGDAETRPRNVALLACIKT